MQGARSSCAYQARFLHFKSNMLVIFLMHANVTMINKLYKYFEAKTKPQRLIIVCFLEQNKKKTKEQLLLMTSI